MNKVYVVDGVRTPVGRLGGALATVRPDDLGATVIRALMERNPAMPHEAIEEVVMGAANQAGEDNRNAARMASLLAGLPTSVAGVTVNRLCASGLEAIIQAYRMLALGEGQAAIAAGAESMTRAPFVVGKADVPFARKLESYDTALGWRFTNPRLAAMHQPFVMGETAENVASQYQISRDDQDAFALQSQERWAAAHARGAFADELIPVHVQDNPKAEPRLVDRDEAPRNTSLEALAKLKPAFKEGGTVTAGNSSGLNDGAAALLLATEGTCEQYGLRPLARVIACAAAGVDPAIMGIGPVPAIRKVLERGGLQVSDIDLFEINEAFAAQSVACVRELGIDNDKMNVNGGAIAIGHPLGCSGARISVSLLHELKRRGGRYGVAALCIGVGQGLAVLYENVVGEGQ